MNNLEENTSQITRQVPEFDYNAPKVSIMVLTHNASEYIDDLLTTLIDNTRYPNYEVILIDNKSDIDVKGFVDKYSENIPIKVVTNDYNKKYSEAYNNALEHATGSYLVFMDDDIKLEKGWLNYLVDSALNIDDVGLVSSKLLNPDENIDQSVNTSIVKFRSENGLVLPYDTLVEFSTVNSQNRIIATAGSLFLIEKSLFEKVGGFDTNYRYGFESVDLSLKLHKTGFKNYIDIDSKAIHKTRGTLNELSEVLLNNQYNENSKIFTSKWNNYLKKELLLDKIEKNNLFSENKLKISFVTLEAGCNAKTPDYLAAKSLAKYLEKEGYDIEFIQSIDNSDKYYVDKSNDVIISLVNSFDIDKIRCDNGLLIKVAWILNWAEWWTNKPFFESFDIVLTTHKTAIDYIESTTAMKASLFYEAVDTDIFNEDVDIIDDYSCDYLFAGTDWNNDRNITELLDPDEIQYNFNIYGSKWSNYDKFKDYYKGYIEYEQMPSVYASTKIVLDDVTKQTSTDTQVNGRVFDAIATGSLVLTNNQVGANELFNDLIPVYDSQDSLIQLLDYYINNPDERISKEKELQQLVLSKHTYAIRKDELIDKLKSFIKSTKVVIKIPTPKEANKYEWGDYHMAVELQREFNRQNTNCKLQFLNDWKTNKDSFSDVVLVLRGVSLYEAKPIHYNILWNISHPNRVSVGELERYDQVYIASEYWAEKISQLVDVPVDSLLQCTNPDKFYREVNKDYETELLFVGNSRRVYRKILQDLLPTDYQLDVYGNEWDGIIDKKYIKATYIPNNKLNQVYSSTKVLLNDHWHDMLEKGFISNRIFDAIACQTVIVSDHVKDIEKVFPDAVVVYDSQDELNDKIKIALDKKNVDANLIKEHTFEKRVEKILKDYMEKRDN